MCTCPDPPSVADLVSRKLEMIDERKTAANPSRGTLAPRRVAGRHLAAVSPTAPRHPGHTPKHPFTAVGLRAAGDGGKNDQSADEMLGTHLFTRDSAPFVRHSEGLPGLGPASCSPVRLLIKTRPIRAVPTRTVRPPPRGRNTCGRHVSPESLPIDERTNVRAATSGIPSRLLVGAPARPRARILVSLVRNGSCLGMASIGAAPWDNQDRVALCLGRHDYVRGRLVTPP